MKIGDEVEHNGRKFRLSVVEKYGPAWLPASVTDVPESVIQELLASLPVCDLAWKMAQDGQKGGV